MQKVHYLICSDTLCVQKILNLFDWNSMAQVNCPSAGLRSGALSDIHRLP